jgi:butyryl-CoA dehydrogenase
MAIEAVRSPSLRAAHAFDTQAPGALELALHAKVFGSETAVRVISDLMRVVGIDSYDRALPLAACSPTRSYCRCSMAGTWAFGDGSCTR